MTRQMPTFSLYLFLSLALAILTGCASIPSEAFREQAEPRLSFPELVKNGQAYEGKKVILGGHILETINEEETSLVTILQAPLDFRNKPEAQDLSEGRFLVRSSDFLDPEVYSKGRMLTVAGTMSGVRERTVGNRSYPHPVIKAEELYLWPEDREPIGPYYPWSDFWHYPWHPRWRPYGPYPWWGW